MVAFVNVCRFTATSSGTGNFVVSSAVTGYQTPASAGAVNGTIYRYRAESSDLTQWEIGEGAYTSGSVTLARTRIYANSSGTTSAINFAAAPQVAITALAEDFPTLGRGYISGLTISNNVGDATNDIDVAAGTARDSTDAENIVLSSALTKRLDAAWAVGTNQGGLDTGSIANTTYHLHVIRRPDTGVVDALFSTSATSPTLPTNYTQFRRIGSIVRSGGAILAFYQYSGGVFLWDSQIVDRSSTSSLAFGLMTISVPAGIVVEPLIDSNWTQSANGTVVVTVWDARLGGSSNNCGGRGVSSYSGDIGAMQCAGRIFTNTSSQINAAVQLVGGATLSAFSLATRGWVDAF